MRYIGIDPGISGAKAVMENGEILLLEPMDEDLQGFCEFLEEQKKASKKLMIFLEKAQSMRGNGLVSTFNYGTHFGGLVGVITALRIPFELVPPQTWTKVMHAGVIGDNAKDRSKIAAKRLFPTADLRNPHRVQSQKHKGNIKDDEGIIDALLILEYGRRKMVRE